MKILAFAASSSQNSINKKLVHYATDLLNHEAKEKHQVEMIDLNDYELPLYSEDKEAELGQPPLAQDFLDKIANNDALIISFAEHNYSYAAAYKNIFDWASRINQKVFQKKPMLLLATSPGPGGGATVLASAVASAPNFEGEVKASFSLPKFYKHFDTDKNQIIHDEFNDKLKKAITLLQPEVT